LISPHYNGNQPTYTRQNGTFSRLLLRLSLLNCLDKLKILRFLASLIPCFSDAVPQEQYLCLLFSFDMGMKV
jgi:hypothetical protein